MKLPLPVAALLFASGFFTLSAEEITLTSEGKANLPIHIEDEALREHAETLASMLKELSGATFTISDQPVKPAITLKLQSDVKVGTLERENYSLTTDSGNGLTIAGTTPLAVRHGVWDVLHRLGYRQYFPGKTWEVIPDQPTLTLSCDTEASPDYVSRRIWYGYGFWDHNREAWTDWTVKNRMGGGFQLNTGHAYGQLIRSQQADFDEHPEYYALVKGERRVVPQAKLCVSNPGVKKAAIRYALAYLEKNPEADSVSIDPSDGGNWCECENCAKIGSPSELAADLANTVAAAVVERFGKDKYVGMYAYNYHSPPPRMEVHPNVIISVATGFIKGGLSADEIIQGWAERGARIGIREYYSVSTWDRDLPGRARGGNLEYLTKTIPHFHESGARFLSAESSDNWGCNGLGYYLASRVLWDVDEAKSREAITDDFLEKAFGPASEEMRIFYTLIEGSNESARLVFSDLLARMYRSLQKARTAAAGNRDVIKRINELILYTHYAERYDAYARSKGTERQANFESLLRYSFRIRNTFMVHSYAHWRDIVNRDRGVHFPESETETVFWRIPEEENPWKSSEPVADSEINEILAAGIARFEPVEMGFEPKSFPYGNLVPALTLHPDLKSDLTPGSAATGRGKRSFYTVVGDEAPAERKLTITGGLIKHYRDRGNIKVSLWKLGGASETGEQETLIAEDETVPPDGNPRTITLTCPTPGTYRIDLDDGNDMTGVTWPEGTPMSWKMASDEHPNSMSGRWALYFFVPKGTTKVGLYAKSKTSAGSQLLRPDGSKALDLTSSGGQFFSVTVDENSAGRLWKLDKIGGNLQLLTVPPFLSRSADELVLPESLR